MILWAADLRHAYGDRVVLNGVDFELGSRARVALTGRNGSGKTTLLRVLLGELRPDGGEVTLAPGLRVGALEQDPDFGAATVAEVVEAALGHVRALEAELRRLETEMATGGDPTGWAETLEAYERAGGYTASARAGRTLAALDLEGFLGREAATLSGGERTRLALAVALVEEPDLLVLDEPTNHLDIAMREWLEGRLRDYRGAVLVVSHDRALLDAVAGETWHLERGRLTVYRGGYSRARAQRLEERRVRGKQARMGAAEVGRLAAAASRVAAWGRNNDRLARRAKAIARRADRARDALVEAPVRERQIAMALQAGDARARTLLRAHGLSKRYGERAVLEGAALRVRAGDRIALLAPNGAGKTTLLRLLLGETGSDDPEAEVRFADGVQPAYFDQTYHGLAPERPVLAQLAARVGEGGARALLGRYGFLPEDWPKRPRELSGGERARAGLALVAASRADLLVLDEPTNHLDVEALEALEEALLAYPGSLLFVTHDRAFAGRVASRVLTIEGGRLLELEGGFEGYLRARRGETRALDPARLLEGELAPPPPPPEGPTLERLEDRLLEIEADLLRGGLSEREAERLRSERERGRARLGELYAERWGAPLEYAQALRARGLEVRADRDGAAWRFWARGGEDCPALEGRLEAGVARLTWAGGDDALPWFRAALLEGAAGLTLERLGAGLVLLPSGEEGAFARQGRPDPLGEHPSGGRVLSGAAYAGWLGLIRPLEPRRPRLVFHPDYGDWARWRRSRRAGPRRVLEP